MSNGRHSRGRGMTDLSRDGGGFVAMPWSVLDCPAYARLSHPGRSLLWEFARQVGRDNNGRLRCSMNYLRPRGWNSSDVVTRAKRELIADGFVHETVMGCRPNKASWYAVTWRALDKLPGYDAGAEARFVRGAYALTAAVLHKAGKPTRGELYDRWRTPKPTQNAALRPVEGVETVPIAPPHGAGVAPVTLSHGAVRSPFAYVPAPPHGHHLDMPSAGDIDGVAFTSRTNVKGSGMAAPGSPSPQ